MRAHQRVDFLHILISSRHLAEGMRRGLYSNTLMISTALPVVLAASRACLSRWPRMLPPRFVAALWAVCLAFGSAVGVQAVIANKLKALVGKVLGDDDDKLAVYITERQWRPSQEFRTRADGRVEMRLDTRGRKELIRWVFSWMPDMKVLAPKGLRDRVADKLWDGLRAQL